MKNKFEIRGDIAVIFLNYKGSVVECTVDKEDLSKVAALKGSWYAAKYTKSRTLYAVAILHNRGNRISLKMHRVITEATGNHVVDHVNKHGLDNRKCNLRICSPADNAQNQRLTRRNTSGHRGVSYKKDKGKWKAYLSVGGKQRHLGYFSTKDEAAEVAKEARRSLMPYNDEDSA